jgi:O-antigen/teichoic acid export membrane protein
LEIKETSLKKRYSVKLFSSVVSGVIGMIIVAIVPKAIGPVAYGQFVYLQQFFIKLIAFLDAGSSIAFFTKLSAQPDRKELITFYTFYSLFILIVLGGVFSFIDLLGYVHILLPDVNRTYVYWGIGFGFLTWLSQVCIKISDAYALTVSVELIKVVHKLLSLFLLLCFIYFLTFDLMKYFYFHIISLSTFIIWLLYLFMKSKVICPQIFSISYEKLKYIFLEFVSYCSPLLIYSVVGLFVGLFDIWLLQYSGGAVQMGYYGLAYSLAAMCFIFTGAMTPIITREFSKSFEQNDLQKMRSLFERYVPMLYSIAAFFAVFLSFQSANVLAIFTDENFENAYWVLVVIALYPIHQTYGQLSGSVFYATDQTKLYRNIGIISMLIGFLLTLFLIYILELDALGLAFKMVLSQIIAVNIQLYFNVKLLKLNMSSFIWHQIYSVTFFAVAAFLSIIFANFSSPILSLLVSGTIYTILTLLGLLIYPKIFSISRVEIKRGISKAKSLFDFNFCKLL